MEIETQVKQWLQHFSQALHEVRLMKLQATDARLDAYEHSEHVLERVIDALAGVTDYSSAEAACNQLKRDAAELHSSGWTHQIDQAIALLTDNILAVHRLDPDKSTRTNAIALLRARISADDRKKIRELMRGDLESFRIAHHFGVGAMVRNLLRRHGYDEASLQSGSLDEIWAELLWEAVSG